jgi:putative hydrolase
MSDNLFEQLFELFQTPGPINWRLAREVTKSLAGSPEPIEPLLAEEYLELALAAQLRLAEASPLDVAASPTPDPIDRAGWAEQNQESYRYLVEPLSDKFSGIGGIGGMGGAAMAGMLQPLGPAILGMQAGSMIGFMSHRVLGQFDAGLPPLDHQHLYLVIPNVEAFAMDEGLDARQVRLWATMHEIAYSVISTVPWLRDHFVAVITDFFDDVEFDPTALTEKLGALEDPSQLEEAFSGPGTMASLLGGERSPEKVAAVQALTAFIEGYGDYVVALAGDGVLPERERIAAAYARRRSEPDQAEQFLQQLVGLELHRTSAGDAAVFCHEVARRWGPEALERIWEGPDQLPTLNEITDPVGWAARVLL